MNSSTEVIDQPSQGKHRQSIKVQNLTVSDFNYLNNRVHNYRRGQDQFGREEETPSGLKYFTQCEVQSGYLKLLPKAIWSFGLSNNDFLLPACHHKNTSRHRWFYDTAFSQCYDQDPAYLKVCFHQIMHIFKLYMCVFLKKERKEVLGKKDKVGESLCIDGTVIK